MKYFSKISAHQGPAKYNAIAKRKRKIQTVRSGKQGRERERDNVNSGVNNAVMKEFEE